MSRTSTSDRPGKRDGERRGYHHGNLRDALILAAAGLIEERGNTEFAMVDAARAAGVSSAAPYRHFRDKAALLEAVVDLLFLGLTQAAREACAPHPLGSEERIISLGKAYIRFHAERPAFYALMWCEHSEQEPLEPDLRGTGFQPLLESVEAWCRAHGVSEPPPIELSTRLWALAHGLMALTLHRHMYKFLPDADLDTLLENTTHSLLRGLSRSGP